MASLRAMLDKPEEHPGLFKATFGIDMTIKAGGPGSGRHKGSGFDSAHKLLTKAGYKFQRASAPIAGKWGGAVNEYKHSDGSTIRTTHDGWNQGNRSGGLADLANHLSSRSFSAGKD